MSPSTVSENGVVGQATSFDLTLNGKTPYTYTQTFGNICSVDINDNIATVTITPTEIGLLTGSITFNEEATCNITIDVQAGITVTPTTVSDTAVFNITKEINFVLDGADTYTMTNTFGNDATVTVTYASLLNNQKRATVRITPKTSGTLTGSITFNEVATATITLTVPMAVNMMSQSANPTIGLSAKAKLKANKQYISETVTNVTSNDFDSVTFSYSGNNLIVEVGNINKTSITGSLTFTGEKGGTVTNVYTVKGTAILELVNGSYSYTGKLNLLYPYVIGRLPDTITLKATTDLTTTPATVVDITGSQLETSDNFSETLTLTDANSRTFEIEFDEFHIDSGYVGVFYTDGIPDVLTATLPVTGSITGTFENVKAIINGELTTGISLPITLTFTDLLKESEIQTEPQNLMFNNAYSEVNPSDKEYTGTFYFIPRQYDDSLTVSENDTRLVGNGTYIDYSGDTENISGQDEKVLFDTEYGYSYDEPNTIKISSDKGECWYNTFTVYQSVTYEPSFNGHSGNVSNLPNSVYNPPIEKQIVYTNIPKYMTYDVDYENGGTVEVNFENSGDASDKFTANAGYLTNGVYRITADGSSTLTTKRCYDVFRGALDDIRGWDYPSNTKLWYDITCNHGTARIIDTHTGTPFDINGAEPSDTVFGNGMPEHYAYIEYTPGQSDEPIQIDIRVYYGENNPFIWSVSPDKVTQTESNERCYTNIKKNGTTIDFNNIPTSSLTCDYVRNIATGEIIARGSDYQAKSVTTGEVAMLVRQGGSSGNICFTGYTSEIPDGEYIIKFTYTPPTSVDPDATPQSLYVTFVMQAPEPEPEPTGYSLTPTTVNDSVTGGYTASYTLTLDVGSDFDSADLYVDNTGYGNASLSKHTMSSAGTFTLSYHADEYYEGEGMTDVFTVTATCHRKDGLPDIELSSTFNITVTEPDPEPPTPTVVTVTPNTVSENGVVGRATSFDLTLSGDSTYTYTQTFGNICNVSINGNTATVTITPITSGTLTGSITFNEEATCNITIVVSEPTPPTGGFNPTSINVSLSRDDSQTCYFELLSGSYDSSTENVDFSYTITNTSAEGDIRGALNIKEDINNPPEYQLILESNNEVDETLTGVVNVYAKIYDDDMTELLRTYTATINVTIDA